MSEQKTIRFDITLLLIFAFIKGFYQANRGIALRRKYFKTEMGKRFSISVNLIAEEIVASKLVCSTKCINEEICCAASFENGTCKLTANCRPEVETAASAAFIKLNSGECIRSFGYEYIGKVNVTPGNRQCQRWDVNTPHVSSMDMAVHMSGTLAENYCRNPDHSSGGPWCYTMDPNQRWEYCNIPTCEGPPKECIESSNGIEYYGYVSQTKSGRVCERWDSQPNVYNEVWYLGSSEENYCRNPYGMREGPWCYVTDPSKDWELCDIPLC